MNNKDSEPPRLVKVSLPLLLAGLFVFAFVIWSIVSAVFVIKVSESIKDTAIAAQATSTLCVDRIMTEVETKKQSQTAIDTLQRENLFLRGRMNAFEQLYGLTKQEYDKKGVGGP